MTDNNISYLRIRPCDSDNEIYLSSRHKEGTSAFTLKNDTKVDFNSLLVKGFQTITSDLSIEASAWFITDETIGHKLTQYSKRLIFNRIMAQSAGAQHRYCAIFRLVSTQYATSPCNSRSTTTPNSSSKFK